VHDRGDQLPRAQVQTELVEKLSFVLPPEPLRTKLTEPLRALMDLWAHNLQESKTLAKLRDTLLPPFMSGELRIKDAEKIVGKAV